MSTLKLLQELRDSGNSEWASACALPSQVRVDFPAEPGDATSRVLKTSTRSVVSSEFGVLQAREIIQVASTPDGRCLSRSQQLAHLVPAGCRYAYDLMVEVGWATLVEGRQFKEVRQELQQRPCPLYVPLSSLWQLQRRFLFYLGALHRLALPRLGKYLARRGGYTALLDGTCEPGSPVLLGVTEAEEQMVLGSWKIPSENASDARRCLEELVQTAGLPSRALHDLSRPLDEACSQALPGVVQRVCHFHFARDVGSDLYEQPQAALVAALRRHKLVARLHDQRKEQVRRLAEIAGQPSASSPSPVSLPVASLLARWRVGLLTKDPHDRVWREVVVAVHHWILDYAHEGSRHGFPFDPYLLYQHRRWQQAEAVLRELLAPSVVQVRASRVLKNLQQWLHDYLSDAQVATALADWECRAKLFHRLRDALRLTACGSQAPLSDPHGLGAADEQAVRNSVLQLEGELQSQPSDAARQIMLKHLQKYRDRLAPPSLSSEGAATGDALAITSNGAKPCPTAKVWSDRTNNKREAQWRQLKRGRRRVHGRGKLNVDLDKLPAEWGLVPNLRNARYVELVLESLDRLAEKFAEAATSAGSYTHWRQQQTPRRPGQHSKRELRSPTFLEDLGTAYTAHCAAATTVPQPQRNRVLKP